MTAKGVRWTGRGDRPGSSRAIASPPPIYIGTLALNTTDEWSRVKVERIDNDHVMMIAGGNVLAVREDDLLAHKIFALPPGVTSPVGYYFDTGYLILTPAPNKVVYYTCALPFSYSGQMCSLVPYRTLALTNVSITTDWVDMAYGESNETYVRYGYLLAADGTVVEIKNIDEPDNAGVTKTFTLASLVPSVVAKYPHVLSVVGMADFDNIAREYVWFTLTGSDPTTHLHLRPPGVVLAFAISTGSIVSTAFSLPTPMGIVHYAESLALTHYGGAITTELIAYGSSAASQSITASWAASGRTASACAINAGTFTNDNMIFVVSEHGSGLELVHIDANTAGYRGGSRGGRRNGGGAPTAASFPTASFIGALDAPADRPFVAIDGSLMEGGGQILRNSFACATLLGKPIHVSSIRAGRSVPGLRAQHLVGINLVAKMCGAELAGNGLKSVEVKFLPPAAGVGRVASGSYDGNIPSAGSTTLLAQVSLPVLLFAPGPTTLNMTGGTNASHAPQIDYTLQVLFPTLARMGIDDLDLTIARRGFYPKGCGKVVLEVSPVEAIRPIVALDRGIVTSVDVFAFTAGRVPASVGPRMADAAGKMLAWWFGSAGVGVAEGDADVVLNVETPHIDEPLAFGNGTGILLVAHTSTGERLAGSALGAKGTPAEDVGRQAAQMLITQLEAGGCTDEYLTDQLIIYMALADGESRIRCGPLSLHTQTAIHFVSLLTGATFDVTPDTDPSIAGHSTNVITCQGIGFRAPPL
ncbi:uncharacterized protein AMSG_12041 [Thecamonas trahens ATCC 50062]|uniref:RNA 3'-terminal-phosphate cyclase (ATP) n=1 Tax=Thecamonas trahens ATCC 50062 TaxID=461836 RepID=A0A0L0DFF1_THETB|nr:hypothetical protein AMSG_12041 [Thecamonas trahens ATCC 50062]KNC50876.1 hypothetical protein AMSG_12041 [Thecamonas trahens ATCC 50062]|eukprot:XP_013756669.1 hypothetical protein AMSG_12041 [Thecamonas trahens ATCC 50062]